MKTRNNPPRSLRRILLGSAALGLALWMPPMPSGNLGFAPSAYAQGSGSGQGGSGTTHRPTSPGQGQGGSTSGHRGQGGSSTTGSSTSEEGSGGSGGSGGQGGSGTSQRPTSPGQGQGGSAGGGGSGEGSGGGGSGGGGKPVWASEGIPAVDLGRLSVARAPASVLNKALTEALTTWDTMGSTELTLVINGVTKTITVAQLYSYPADQFSAILLNNFDVILRIDSPLQNLALLQSYGTTGVVPLSGVKAASKVDLMGIFLGSASDKEVPITTDTVIAMNTILGLNLTPSEITQIAVTAEEVRVAILTAHG